MQCDFDTIGTQSAAADAEIILVVHDLMRAIELERFTIRINHRGILSAVMEKSSDNTQIPEVLRVLDKLDKIGANNVADELAKIPGVPFEVLNRIIALADSNTENELVLSDLDEIVRGNTLGESSVNRLREILSALSKALSPEAIRRRVRIEPAIARGLDYYTGIVLETTLDQLPKIGSVCSGGRYDNLADLYTNQHLPGIGASLGLDRLLAAMEELGMLGMEQTPAQVFIPYFDAAHLADYLKLAAELRAAGLNVEVYPEPSKLGKQLQYADRKKFRVAVIAGEREFAAAECQIKNLSTTESTTVPLNATAVIAEIQRIWAK
jgi:histidyl-tRNA synthetase